MNQLWQIWYNGVSPDYVDKMVTNCEKYPVITASMGEGGDKKDESYRNSEIRWVHPSNEPEIYELIWGHVREANRNAFGFHIDYLNDIQFTTYKSENQGKYDWHCDTFWSSSKAYDRKISVVIQLSDSDEYEGGDFEFDNDVPPPDPTALRKKGVVIVFPSFLRHRVTPVTKGVRKSLVAWIEGPKFR